MKRKFLFKEKMVKRERALKVINEMYEKGILKNYAIGGAVATIFYTEPFLTQDIDIFFIPPDKAGIITLTPFYSFLLAKGYETYKEYIMIAETPIQFIPASTELEIEALENAIEVKVKNIKTRVLRPEYLIAIFLEVFRPKDKEKIRLIMEQVKIDKKLLSDILDRYKLKKKFEDFLNE